MEDFIYNQIKIADRENLAIRLNQGFEPIELTEELLLKLGFKEWWYYRGVEEGFLAIEGIDEILFSIESKTIHISTYPAITFDTKIKYLHELQILFYLIHKTELQFKP